MGYHFPISREADRNLQLMQGILEDICCLNLTISTPQYGLHSSSPKSARSKWRQVSLCNCFIAQGIVHETYWGRENGHLDIVWPNLEGSLSNSQRS